MGSKKDEQLKAAAFFMQRAQEAMDAAENAPSEHAGQALYKEAETWLYMAGKSLNPATERPKPMSPPPARIARERRSFGSED
ncbi:hypothetical protein [Phenylobacterium sp.]|jgi:hypothetical protein|uniref:hypothetical protein n=1 Tax=Phenylobacterium sp. TaxID=1871053 RepID=UPI002F950205